MRARARVHAGVLALLSLAPLRGAPETFTLVETIALPGVTGRIDHFDLDVAGQRLFVAALGHNTVEVVDLQRRAVVHSIGGLAEPQGVFFSAEQNRLYVANGGDGVVRAFDGTTFAPVAAVSLDDDADNVRFDAHAHTLFVGCGSGSIVLIDPQTNRRIGEIPLAAHPESFQLEHDGPRLFVNVPSAHQLVVADRTTQKILTHWPLGAAAENFPMALDEADHRLFVGCRLPGRLLIFDTASGREIARLDLHGDCDDLFVDGTRRQVYATCGEGFLDAFGASANGTWTQRSSLRTAPGARTSLFDGQHLYLAVPHRGQTDATVRVYEVH